MLGYLARFIVCIMTLEMILHFMYVVAIKDRKAWVNYSAAELCMVGFWNLIVVWLKGTLPFLLLPTIIHTLTPKPALRGSSLSRGAASASGH